MHMLNLTPPNNDPNKKIGAAGGDRTHDPWLRRPILYPLSYSRNAEILPVLTGGMPENPWSVVLPVGLKSSLRVL